MQSPSVWRVWIEIVTEIESYGFRKSPSVWRVWIEIFTGPKISICTESPSVWRVWIEITSGEVGEALRLVSPSVWRVWIEIIGTCSNKFFLIVTLRVEGVD